MTMAVPARMGFVFASYVMVVLITNHPKCRVLLSHAIWAEAGAAISMVCKQAMEVQNGTLRIP